MNQLHSSKKLTLKKVTIANLHNAPAKLRRQVNYWGPVPMMEPEDDGQSTLPTCDITSKTKTV